MDRFFEEMPSTSQSTPKTGHKDAQMTEETDYDSSIGTSSSVSMTKIQEHQNSSRIDCISRRVQELVEKINNRRTSDQKVIDSFHEKLVEKVTDTCQQMTENMYNVYEKNSNEMQVKLQEITEVLERCTKLNNELLEATQALSRLREVISSIQDSSLDLSKCQSG